MYAIEIRRHHRATLRAMWILRFFICGLFTVLCRLPHQFTRQRRINNRLIRKNTSAAIKPTIAKYAHSIAELWS